MAERGAGALRPEVMLPSLGSAATRRSPSTRPGFLAASLAAAALAALASTLVWNPRPALLWNASASSPVGLYRVDDPRKVRTGDMVVAWPPVPVRQLAASRLYLPLHVPLVKRVAAAAGDRVCARGGTILINGRPAAVRRRRDPRGRPLPWWSGCRRLGKAEFLLLSRSYARAFDGRYFGITQGRDIVGRAHLLWPG